MGGDKNYAKADALWKEVIRKGPAKDEWVAESHWHQVQLLAGPLGKGKEAVALCEKVAAAQEPGSFRHEQALYSKAWLLWTQHEWKPSLEAFTALVKAYPAKNIHPAIVEYIKDCHRHIADPNAK
jgi:hypothetical protein